MCVCVCVCDVVCDVLCSHDVYIHVRSNLEKLSKPELVCVRVCACLNRLARAWCVVRARTCVCWRMAAVSTRRSQLQKCLKRYVRVCACVCVPLLPIVKTHSIVPWSLLCLLPFATHTMLRACVCVCVCHTQDGVSATVIDARFCKPLDTSLIRRAAKEHPVMISIEEGSIGGFAAHVMQFLALEGTRMCVCVCVRLSGWACVCVCVCCGSRRPAMQRTV